jgi:general secretion pathway protein J
MNARRRGFSLIELVVALAVFAALAAAAYGGLATLARTRSALAERQDRFAGLVRAVSTLERDLRGAIARPILGNDGRVLPAFAGSADALEFTRVGFADPRTEARSQLERVAYSASGGGLRRGRYTVLDRAPDSAPVLRDLLARAGALHLRYLGCDQAWRDAWPPRDALPCEAAVEANGRLPRAVEFRVEPPDLGEIRRVVELPGPWPPTADDAVGAP